MREGFFIFFSLLTIACALGVVFAKNAVYSAFSLVLSFFGLAAIYVLWGATFIAMVQILIYTGAIVVLFLFVVMLLDIAKGPPTISTGWWMAALTGATVWVFSVLLLRTLNKSGLPVPTGTLAAVDIRTISKLLFSEYLWPFEVLSIFMLALIVAAFALARPEKGETP